MTSGNVHRFESNDDLPPAPMSTPGETSQPVPGDIGPVADDRRTDLSGTFTADPPFWRSVGRRNDRAGWRDGSL